MMDEHAARAEAGKLLHAAGLRGMSAAHGAVQSVLQVVLLRAWRAEAALRAAIYCISNHCGEVGPCDCDQSDVARAATQWQQESLPIARTNEWCGRCNSYVDIGGCPHFTPKSAQPAQEVKP